MPDGGITFEDAIAGTTDTPSGGISFDDAIGSVKDERPPSPELKTIQQNLQADPHYYAGVGGFPMAAPPGGPFEPLAPIPELHGTTPAGKVGAGLYNVAKSVPEAIESPGGLATLPLAGAGGLIGALSRLVFGGLATKGAAEKAGQASVTGDVQDITEAIGGAGLAGLILGKPTNYLPNARARTLQSVAEDTLSKIKHDAAAETTTPTVSETTPQVPLSEMPNVPTKSGVYPAVREVGGKVDVGEPGETHPDIIKDEKLTTKDIDQRGFVDERGKFLDREQAAEKTGLPTEREEDRLHSTDLTEAKETLPNEPLPDTVTPSSQSLGISFPGMAPIARGLQRAWEGLRTAVSTSPNKESMSAHMDAAENGAKIAGNYMGNRVRLMLPNEMDRKAATFVIEAKGDPANLGLMRNKVSTKDIKYRNIIDHAIKNWGRLKPVADQISQIQDNQRAFEQSKGVDTDYFDGYVKHAYDRDLMMGVNRPVVFGSRGGGVASAFKKQRTFPTYADAIEAGYTPATLDVSKLVDSRVAAGTKMVNRIEWGNALRGVTDPTSGKPIVTSLIKQPKGTEVAPPGYVTDEVLPGIRVAVHEGYESIFDALKGGSKISELEVKGIPVGELALKTEGAIKHGLLAFDTFHASRIMQKQLFLTGKIGWARGKTLLDYEPSDLSEGVKQGLITQDMADYALANKPTADLLVKEGLNVGRVQEALYADTVKNLPVIGRFNKWVFDKVTRGAMLESGIREFNRVKKQNTKLTDEEVARKVSRDLNFYYGNIGRQGLFKSKTWQDVGRLVALAPQWVESMAQTEARGYGQIARVPIDSVRAGQLKVGTLAKGLGQGLAAYFVGTQLLNLATRKKPTWDNPEKEHKLDAWIPDVTGKTAGYFISPFSVVAELTHDFIRYASKKDTPLDAAAQIARNKFSPLTRAATTLFTGKDYSGREIDGTWNRIKQSAWDLAPTPIPLSGPIKGTSYPGQIQRQLIGSAGFKVEPAQSEKQERIARIAKINRYVDRISGTLRRMPAEQRRDYADQRIEKDWSEDDRSEVLKRLKRKGVFRSYPDDEE